jgi:hypothetical protein
VERIVPAGAAESVCSGASSAKPQRSQNCALLTMRRLQRAQTTDIRWLQLMQ